MFRTLGFAAATCMALSQSTTAAVLFAFEETGEGVVGTFSGSLDLSTAVFEFDRARDDPAIIVPSSGLIASSVGPIEYDAYMT